MGMFCPKCSSLLRPKSVKSGTALACSCGYVEKNTDMEFKEPVKKKKGEEIELSIVEKDREEKRLPLTETECPKCGHRKAYYWLQQTRAGDEPETRFCKCEKCNHTWREYD